MTVTNWARQVSADSATASPFQTNVMAAIIPAGSTIRRSIVTFDWWVDSNTTLFVDVGAPISYGLSLSTSSTVPAYHPYTDAAATGTPNPWLYWDQIDPQLQYTYDLSGTVYYLAKNTDASRHIDTRTQRKNSTTSPLYLWFGIEPAPGAVTNWSNTYWSVSSQIFYESPT